MSAERLPSVKQSKREAVKKWAKTRWDEFRSGSPSSATPPSAPPTPLGSGATGDTELGQHASGASQNMPVVGGGQSKSSPSQFDTVKDYLDVTGSFLLLVLKKVPDAVDSNPAKVVFSLAKSILELKEGMDDNANSVKNRIFAISELLQTLEAAMSGWEGSNSDDEKELMESFKQQVLEVEAKLVELVQIKNQSRFRRFAVQEEDKQKIIDIFDAVEGARNRFMLATSARIHKIAASFRAEFDRFLSQHLKIATKADHKYYPSGDELRLRRHGCTPGTRVNICGSIIHWATDPFAGPECFYWLSGQAGAGKSTIAYTVTLQLESLPPADSGGTALGATFFCSRHFPETRSASAIVRTIVYRLALASKAFKTALKQCGDLKAVDRSPRSQLEDLLVGPWKKSALGRLAGKEPCYVVTIDAVDELDGVEGVEFLGTLFDVINKHDLSGLKFFVTCRPDPALVQQIEAFQKEERICRLEEVSVEESAADVRLYLKDNLRECASDGDIDQLVRDAAGLFIYAATVVEYVKGRTPKEQKNLLKQFLTPSRPLTRRPSRGATAALDDLYLDVLETSLVDSRDRDDPDALKRCLRILHTFLCTVERTSTSVAATLLASNGDGDGTDPADEAEFGDSIVSRLHAVLYVKDGQVLWFHQSFPDFIFDERRSQTFYCNQAQHHRLLVEGCFDVMKNQLRFNIADIPNSFHLDDENATLLQSVERDVSAALRYTCRCWSAHLTLTDPQKPDPLPPIIIHFLQLRILFWVEAMNLLKQRGRCEGMLHEARKWVALSKNSGLAYDLNDAAAFALHFSASGAALSTPHLYLSSLATFSRDSTLLRKWREHFQGIPTFTNAHGAISGESLTSFMVGSWVYAVAVSVDGTQIASVSQDGLLQIWSVSTGEVSKALRGHAGRVTSAAFSPDGSRLVSGSWDRSLRLWDIGSGEELKNFSGHAHVVNSATYSPDGTLVASGSHDNSVRVWDVASGEERRVFKGHTGSITSVVFSPRSTTIISGSDDSTVRVWEISTGKTLAVLKGHTRGVTSVAHSPDNIHIASASQDGSVRVWQQSTGEELKILNGHTSGMTSVVYSANGAYLAAGSHDNLVRLWNASTGDLVKVLRGHIKGITSLAYLPGGECVVSGSIDGSMRLWDASLGNEQPDANRHNGHGSKSVNSVAYSCTGTHVASGSSEGLIQIWDARTGKESQLLQGHESKVTSLAYSPSRDGVLLASGSQDSSVRVWDLATSKESHVLKGHAGQVNSVAFSPDGIRVVSGSQDHSVRVWDAASGEQLQVLNGHEKEVFCVAPSRDGMWAASCSSDRTVRIWDLTTWEQVKVLRGHTDWVSSVAYSPDGTRVVSGSHDASIRIWDVLAGTTLEVVVGHASWVNSVAYSPDGAHILSGSLDRSVRVWDGLTGKLIATLSGHTQAVNSVGYSADGSRVVSGSSDKSVRLWRVVADHSSYRYIKARSPLGEHTGWLVSPIDSSSHLMFVHPAENLPDDCNTLTMPSSLASRVDFSTSKLGEGWTDCYTPKY